MEDFEINYIKPKNLKYDESIFKPLRSKYGIDLLFSDDIGVMPATNTFCIGDAGVGKSTVCLHLGANILKNEKDKRILYISSEMTKIDMYKYFIRFPELNELTMMYFADHSQYDPKLVLEKTLNDGWDLVILDSFGGTLDSIKSFKKKSKNEEDPELWLLNLFIKNNEGGNLRGLYTSFIPIQRNTKGGVYEGSNKIIYTITSMMELKYTESKKERYIIFTKNRRGSVGNPLYFDISYDSIDYDIDRFNKKENVDNYKLEEEDEKHIHKMLELDKFKKELKSEFS